MNRSGIFATICVSTKERKWIHLDAEHQKILDHYDALARMARARCISQTEAEDLVADTMLAAFSYLHRGGVIEHPKSWLANTLMHLHNSALRRKYRDPVVVRLDALGDMADEDDEDEAYSHSEEAAEVRRVLNDPLGAYPLLL